MTRVRLRIDSLVIDGAPDAAAAVAAVRGQLVDRLRLAGAAPAAGARRVSAIRLPLPRSAGAEAIGAAVAAAADGAIHGGGRRR